MRMAVRHDPALLVGLGVALLAVTSGYTAPGANEKAVRSDIQYIRHGKLCPCACHTRAPIIPEICRCIQRLDKTCCQHHA